MGHTSALDTFLNGHREQLIVSGVPEHFWQALHKKLINQEFDAGNFFQIAMLEYDEEQTEHDPIWALQAIKDIKNSDPQKIYLIDHAWTYQVNQAKQQLIQHGILRSRLCSMLNLDTTTPLNEIVDKILINIWKINNTYSIQSAENVEDRLPIWYVMDEIGSAVLHSDMPNCRVVPFVYINEQITYSLLFPIKDIGQYEIIYRDFAEGILDPVKRSAALLPWVPKSFEDISEKPDIPSDDYYLSGHIKESLPLLSNFLEQPIRNDTLKVFSQYSLVNKYLTDSKFELVEEEETADILWYTQHFKDFETLSETPKKFINQFPFEYVLTVKDLLCMTCRRYKNNGRMPSWLPITYNLNTEVGNFVSCFQKREKQGLDNFWIIKPYNLARGMDIHITNNLNYIMRLPVTGPKIVQKYITKPVLFYRPECAGKVKFDIRYVILLKSVKPLQVYVYKEFFLRFANKPFELNDFDDYEKHFTVMNYNENVILKHMKCDEFKINWEQQYTSYSWGDVEADILTMIKEILECAVIEEPPCGIAESPQSRALYAADIMLDWSNNKIQPKVLEVNFMPDCQRACEYYPSFYNDIFNLLFFNEESDVFFKL